jgi:hypothetical protein
MAEYIAQITFQGNTGLSKDRYENTFHFAGAAGPATAADAMSCVPRIVHFFLHKDSTYNNSVASFLSPILSRTAHIRVYDFAAGTRGTGSKRAHTYVAGIPRPILAEATMTLPTAPAAGIPEEVAICLSYWTVANRPRHRGRLYLGPLCTDAMSMDSVHSVRPSAMLVASLAESGANLAATPDSADDLTASWAKFIGPDPSALVPGWSLLSTIGAGTKLAKVPTYELVTHGWVSNEWSGQSRRRVEATARHPF